MATDIYKVLARCIRVGRVSSVDTADASVRVTFPDHDNIVSAPLKVLMRGCKSTKDFWMPAVDDQVLCLFVADNCGSLKVNAGGGDVTVNGISLVSHVHGGVSSGGSNTGKPQ